MLKTKELFRRAFKARCPHCGEGQLFQSYLRLNESCEECELIYRREHGAETGAMYASAVITELFAASLCAALFLFTDWSVRKGLLIGVPLVGLFGLLTYPLAMSFWVAVEYWTDLQNGESWTKQHLEKR